MAHTNFVKFQELVEQLNSGVAQIDMRAGGLLLSLQYRLTEVSCAQETTKREPVLIGLVEVEI